MMEGSWDQQRIPVSQEQALSQGEPQTIEVEQVVQQSTADADQTSMQISQEIQDNQQSESSEVRVSAWLNLGWERN